jgi:hypothetical protein
MNKLLILAAALLILALAVPAMATVIVTGDIYKDKYIIVDENVVIDKDIYIVVHVDVAPVKAAEADSLVNQDNTDNTVAGIGNLQNGLLDYNYRTAVIDGSIKDNIGIVQVNQDAGNMNNQANVTSAAVAIQTTDEELPALANSQASAEQFNSNNSETAFEASFTDDNPPLPNYTKVDWITNSINRNLGIVGVNQSVGNMNNQANQVAIAIADGAIVALAEADLGQFNSFNSVIEFGTVKTDYIYNSINSNHGIVGVNQSAGNMNNQANIVSISGIHP